MRPVEYPIKTCPNYEDLYLQIYSHKVAGMQTEWVNLKNKYAQLVPFPNDIKDILVASYHDLVEIYNQYQAISENDKSVMDSDLESLFNYDSWYDEIALYFMKPAHGFNFSTCQYCDTAYVNTYKVNTEEEALFFLNTASDKELMLKINTKSQNSVKKYKRARPYSHWQEFENVALSLGCKPGKFKNTFSMPDMHRRHFDVEHILPKSECPLVALSLYNYLPSCQICNSKLKKTHVLGRYGIPLEKLSPTSPDFYFDRDVTFQVLPKLGCKLTNRPTQHIDDYVIKLDTSIDPDYELFVKLFKLEERYDYHKIVALHWVEQKYRYNKSRIQMMVNALHDPSFSPKRIYEDIFQIDIDGKQHRAFGKLKNDILK